MGAHFNQLTKFREVSVKNKKSKTLEVMQSFHMKVVPDSHLTLNKAHFTGCISWPPRLMCLRLCKLALLLLILPGLGLISLDVFRGPSLQWFGIIMVCEAGKVRWDSRFFFGSGTVETFLQLLSLIMELQPLEICPAALWLLTTEPQPLLIPTRALSLSQHCPLC